MDLLIVNNDGNYWWLMVPFNQLPYFLEHHPSESLWIGCSIQRLEQLWMASPLLVDQRAVNHSYTNSISMPCTLPRNPTGDFWVHQLWFNQPIAGGHPVSLLRRLTRQRLNQEVQDMIGIGKKHGDILRIRTTAGEEKEYLHVKLDTDPIIGWEQKLSLCHYVNTQHQLRERICCWHLCGFFDLIKAETSIWRTCRRWGHKLHHQQPMQPLWIGLATATPATCGPPKSQMCPKMITAATNRYTHEYVRIRLGRFLAHYPWSWAH